jgi:hypothetical protein
MNITRMNDSVGHLIHAYAQAPWRSQRRRIVGLLVAVLGLAMVAALYLDVTSRAAIAGRQIQDLTSGIITIQQGNADLQSQLAQMTSTSTMAQRAKTLGYEPVDPAQLNYVLVPGYVAPTPDILGGGVALRPSAPSVPAMYTESLMAWLSRQLQSRGTSNPGVSQ